MNSAQRATVDRLLRTLDRRAKRPRPRFSLSALYLGVGLLVGYQLLVRFVPLAWSALLPGGIEQAPRLGGWAGLIWRLGLLCRQQFVPVVGTLAAISAAGFLFGRGPWPCRLLVWLAAVGVVLLDAGILLVVIRTSLAATMQDSGLF